MIYIGIDPAFRLNGFCACCLDTEDNSIRFVSFKKGFIDFYKWFMSEAPVKAIFCIENSNLQNTTFKHSKIKGVAQRMSRDAGKNQAISQITVDLCKIKYKVIDLSPKHKGKKWTHEQYLSALKREGIAILKKRSNQDQRDAAKLAIIAKNRSYLAR